MTHWGLSGQKQETVCSIDFVKLHGRMQSAELAEKFPVCYGIQMPRQIISVHRLRPSV
jgi:hypothetical protein